MLGLGRDKPGWQWAACGKHPLGKDYFRFYLNSPIQSAFAVWVDDGFAALPKNAGLRRAICFWRFWAKGTKKGQLVCGLLKASSDEIGRPYPLLIVGVGDCNGWEKNWESLPATLEATWRQVEYIASKRFTNLKAMADAVHSLQAPGGDFPGDTDTVVHGFDPERGCPAGDTGYQGALAHVAHRLREEKALLMPLDVDSRPHPPHGPLFWGTQLKKRDLNVPQAFFLGGTPGRTFLAVFARSLHPADFVRLWRAGTDT